jgi:hypothetical protein
MDGERQGPGHGGPAVAARGTRPTWTLARFVALALILVPIGLVVMVVNQLRAPTPETPSSSSFSPASVLAESQPHFLPTPVAALKPQPNAGPPAAAADEAAAAPAERVKVANTGGAGALIRAEPPRGNAVTALRDGTPLQVLDHREVDDGSEWLRVRTPDGTEGWIFSRLTVALDE